MTKSSQYTCVKTCRIADIITTPFPGVQKSALSPTEVSRQQHVTVTWAPTTSDAGPATSVFCFYAVDIAGYVYMHLIQLNMDASRPVSV